MDVSKCMKEQNLGNDDARLSRVFREWPVGGPLPPRFQERVWQRIEAAESRRAATGFLPDWLVVLFARPAYATIVAALLLVVGVSAGLWKADRVTTRWDNQLAQRYVASVDPYVNQQ